jgi:hypothetical protein
MNKTLLRRVLHPEVKIVNAEQGLVDYIASDETLDYSNEIIRASGWRFTNFAKNAPFVDSHNYSTIGSQLGKVVSWTVEGGRLTERVQWAKDLPDTLAAWGWKMLVGGFLKAVSVGFYPQRYATKWDSDLTAWRQQLAELGLHEESGVRVIYIEQEQIELSACILGCNPNALAKAFKAGCLSEQDLDNLSTQMISANSVSPADNPGVASETNRRARLAVLLEIQKSIHS